MKMSAPCYNCEKRTVGCHAICADYKDFSEAREKARIVARLAGDIDEYLRGEARKAKKQFYKRRKYVRGKCD